MAMPAVNRMLPQNRKRMMEEFRGPYRFGPWSETDLCLFPRWEHSLFFLDNLRLSLIPIIKRSP